MRSNRGRYKISKQQQPVVGIQQRRHSRQGISDPAAAAALAQIVNSQQQANDGSGPGSIMNEVDAEADDDSPIIAAGASESNAAAAIAAMSELGAISGVDVSSISMPAPPTTTSPTEHHHHSLYPPPPAPPQHHSQHSHQSSAGPYSETKTTEQMARECGYNFVVDSTMGKRLSREPGMRHAQQRRMEQVLNLQRRSNVEALFAHIAGEVAPSPCKNCHKGHGPWTQCVVVDGQMCGSCANCWFNASGARCSFHEARNPPHQAHANAAVAAAAAPPSLLHSDSSFGIPPMTPSAAQTATISQLQSLGATPSMYSAYSTSAVDGMSKQYLDRALSEMRAADKKTRQLLMVEMAARQLAFNIVQFEDMTREEQQTQTQAQGEPQHNMLDDPTGQGA